MNGILQGEIEHWYQRALGAEEGLKDALEACEIYKARIARLEEDLRISKTGEVAFKAGMTAFAKQHPESPLLKQVGVRKDGKALSAITQLWIREFDETAATFGLRDPAQHRIG